MSRAAARVAARWLAGFVLLAQLMVATYACPVGVHGDPAAAGTESGQAFAALVSFPAAAAPRAGDGPEQAAPAAIDHSDCDGMQAGTGDPVFSNLCAEHCKAGDQSDRGATPLSPLPVAAAHRWYLVPEVAPPMPPLAPRRLAALHAQALASGQPPHAILHCVLRT